jgi:hypothetical protein
MKRIFVIFFVVVLLLTVTAPTFTAFAQPTTTGTADIAPGTVTGIVPDDFSFPEGFVSNTTTQKIYKFLDPTVTNETLQILDADEFGGFKVDMYMSDLVPSSGSDNVIRFTKVGVVTLSNSSPEPTDTAPFNRPTGTPNINIVAPAFCDWDLATWDLESVCDDDMQGFTAPSSNSTTLSTDINPSAVEIEVADGSRLASPAIGYPLTIKIDSDLIVYSGISGNTLTGVSDINNTHFSGTTVSQYYSTSEPMTIMTNPAAADVGVYSTGFGLRLTISPGVSADVYTGTITFSISPI